MEEERTGITNKHGRKKIHPLGSLSIGGEGGITGLLVFGGALAVAGFMAVASFASNKRKAKGIHDHQPKPIPQQLLLDENGCKTQEDHQTNQNLTSLLQHPNIQHEDAPCCWTSDMSIDQETSELLSAQPSVLEKTELKASNVEESPTRFHHQEIVFSDYSRPESAVSSNESGVGEENMESLLNNSSGHAQEVENDESQDGLTTTETEMEDDEVEEDDDDMMSDEDSSKVTVTTSEAIWPAKLIQKPEQKFKGEFCDSHVCCDSDGDGLDYVGDDEAIIGGKQVTLNQKVNLSMVRNGKSSLITNWVYPLLLLPLLSLLLLLLTRRSKEAFYVLDDGSSIIVP
ncbi:hypothetical protein VNO77_18061 [Canavalia gladiata]|uniref:Uncharacterized protein n=1 Tax=Canavalia gladiata TaxID=3824 RepID=A0AAN9LK46_CANGL